MENHADEERAVETPPPDDGDLSYEEPESQSEEDTGDPDYPVPGA